MTFRAVPALLALLPLAACAGPKPAAETQADRFATLAFAADSGARTGEAPPSVVNANAYLVEFAFERSDGSRMAAQPLRVRMGQAGAIALVRPSPYQPDVNADSVAPATPPLDEGIRIETCADRAGDGGVVLSFRARMNKVMGPDVEATTGGAEGRERVLVPQQDVVEISGTRWLEPGVRGMLARVPSPDRSGQLLVLARVTPQRVEQPADESFSTSGPQKGDLAPPSELARPMSGHTVHLRVSAVRVARDFAPGAVIDETAAPDVLKVTGGEILRDFEAYTCLDSRVRLAGTSGPASFAAALGDDGVVTIEWNGRSARVKTSQGRRFVAVAPVEGGGTAGVIVSVNADD